MTEQTETTTQPETTTPASGGTADGKHRPRKVGVVTSDKADRTLTVRVERLVKHPLYRKYVRRRTILKVHDAEKDAKVGDKVEVEFCRPLSKTKRWRLVRVLERAEG